MQYMVLTFAQPTVAHDTKLLAFLFLCGLEFRSGAKFRLMLALLWARVSQFARLKQLLLWKPGCLKADEFLEKFQRGKGAVIRISKIYIANLPFNWGYLKVDILP